MAGVRCDFEGSFEERGLPTDTSYEFNDRYYSYISDSEEEGCVTPEQAKKWVDQGSSVFKEGSKDYISGPDWHTVSWLTLPEFEKVMVSYRAM